MAPQKVGIQKISPIKITETTDLSSIPARLKFDSDSDFRKQEKLIKRLTNNRKDLVKSLKMLLQTVSQGPRLLDQLLGKEERIKMMFEADRYEKDIQEMILAQEKRFDHMQDRIKTLQSSLSLTRRALQAKQQENITLKEVANKEGSYDRIRSAFETLQSMMLSSVTHKANPTFDKKVVQWI